MKLVEIKEGDKRYVIAAKNIRTELKAAFPGTKFSVVSESFSMGNSVDIMWTDGPTSQEVSAITCKYEHGTFDGMTDSSGIVRSIYESKYGSAKYVQCHRRSGD